MPYFRKGLPLQQYNPKNITMKKLFTLFFLLTAFLGIKATNEVHLGFCNGVVNKSSTVGATGRNWVDAAILLQSNMLQAYASNSLSKVRVGLASSLNIDTLKVWVRHSLDGENIAEGEILKSSIVRGWNEVALKEPYVIPSDVKPLYIGYSFKQRGSINAISFVQETNENAFWVRLGRDKQWTDMCSQGSLSLEAVVSGDNIYRYDVGISNQAATSISNSNDISISATFKNFGTETVKSIDLHVGSSDTDLATAHLDMDLPAGKLVDTTFVVSGLQASATLANTLFIGIDKVNGEPDENPSNDNVSLPFANERIVLLEEFTSEGCQNCPRLANTIHTVLSTDEFKGRAVVVCHHDGFSQDFLTVPSDTEYTWFYNYPTTYAPALMIDRYPYFKTKDNKDTPVSDMDAEVLRAALNARLSVPTYTRVNIDAEKTSEEDLHVTVTGFRARPFCDTPARITLYLLEDSIVPHNQQGANAAFRHMHVERIINSTWGEVIEWNEDGTFKYEYDMHLAENWDRNQLSLVAFIGGYDAENPNNCVVENSQQLSLNSILTSGINDIQKEENDTPSELFTIDGRRVKDTENLHGIFIMYPRHSAGQRGKGRVVIK